MINEYLKNSNLTLNKKITKLNTFYFHLNESLMKAKSLKTDELSKSFLKLSASLEKFITIDSIVNYVTMVSPIISYQKLNQYLNEKKNIGIIVFDTETTGLIKRSSFDEKKKKFINRNQIYELAAITYNYSLEEIKENNKVDFFHAKVKDAALNAQNSVQKISDKIKKILNSNIDSEAVEKAYILATEKNKFNPDYKIFESNLPEQYKNVAGLLIKMMPISKLRKMTKADKEEFIDLWDGQSYMVNFYDSEMSMIYKFFDYIEKQKRKFDNIYILAHNLSYDKDMIMGAIEDSISYWQKKDNNQKEEVRQKMLANAQLLQTKANAFFSQSIDTLDGFKTLINEKKYIDKIELLAKKMKIYRNKKNIPAGEKGFISKLIVRMSKLAKTKNNDFRRTSLGSLAPKSINKSWHTALNDVFVTIKTTKMYFTIPIIISILIKISEDYEKTKTITNFLKIKIPISLIKFSIKNKFHLIYQNIKKEVPETYNNPFYAKNTARKVIPSFLKDQQQTKDNSSLEKENKTDTKTFEKSVKIQNSNIDVDMKLYDTLKDKGFDVKEEYIKAKKIKQGSKYIVDKIKKKFNLDIDKNQIIIMLKHLGLKK